jgi:hypothetical protein
MEAKQKAKDTAKVRMQKVNETAERNERITAFTKIKAK